MKSSVRSTVFTAARWPSGRAVSTPPSSGASGTTSTACLASGASPPPPLLGPPCRAKPSAAEPFRNLLTQGRNVGLQDKPLGGLMEMGDLDRILSLVFVNILLLPFKNWPENSWSVYQLALFKMNRGSPLVLSPDRFPFPLPDTMITTMQRSTISWNGSSSCTSKL